MHKLSIVIPIYNEEGNVAALHEEIVKVCQNNNYVYEIILVDDGSSDETISIANTLAPVKLIELRKNFGQTAAMDAGIKAAQYPYIITMDGDRQNDPADIPLLIESLETNNFDVVSGWRKNRKDSFMKRFVSRGANFLRKVLINDGIHDSGCSLKIYKKECFEGISLYGEMHRFIPALLEIKGFKVGEVVVNHRARTAGVTKYNWRRTIKGFIDMIAVWFWNKYAMRPLHLLGGVGLILLFLSVICMGVSVVLFFQGQDISDTSWPILTILLFLSGLNMFVGGVLADILVKGYYKDDENSYYSIKKIIVNTK
ncbi:MAG: glycosyltransferase family 2 protein [Chitinophagales bacterium]